MYQISDAYKAAMYTGVRQAACHCELHIGVVDATAAPDAALTWPKAADPAKPENVAAGTAGAVEYASFETDFFRLDGALTLLPDDPIWYAPQGWISRALSGEDGSFAAPQELAIRFGIAHDMAGLTVTFGPVEEALPAQLTLTAWLGQTQLATVTIAPTRTVQPIELGITGADRLTLSWDKTRAPGQRARLRAVIYGIGYVFGDADIVELTETHTDAPVATELPQAKLAFSLDDTAGRFPISGQSALVQFLREGQYVDLRYGVETAVGTEWIPGGVWQLDGWSIRDRTANFTAHDRIQELHGTTYETSLLPFNDSGFYSETPKDKFAAVMADAGLSEDDWVWDLAGTIVGGNNTALPVLTHAEAAQALANYVCARLYTDRTGRVCVKHYPTVWQLPRCTASGILAASDAASLPEGSTAEYASFEADFFRLDGRQRLWPENTGTHITGAGLIGSKISGAAGTLGKPLICTLTLPSAMDVYGITLDFGTAPPAALSLSWQDAAGNTAEELALPVQDVESAQHFAVNAPGAKTITLRITATRKAGQLAHLYAARLTHTVGLQFGTSVLRSAPTEELLTKLRTASTTRLDGALAPFTSELGEYPTNGGTIRLERQQAATHLTVTVEDSTDTAASDPVQIEQTHYAYVSYITLTSSADKKVKLTLSGWQTNFVDVPVTLAVNATGEDLTIANPMYDYPSRTSTVLAWMAAYYARRIQYTYETLGYPELECGDYILDHTGQPAQIVATELRYNGGLQGTYRVREVQNAT